ncbi:MAG TPA: PilZ domain-containing protein, partial [Candidatus Eremiobacteraceae bacterium]
MGIFDGLNAQKSRASRSSARIPVEVRVDARLARDGAVHSVLLEDLAAGGARISTPMRLSKSDVLTIIVETAYGVKIQAVCRIVSIRPRHGQLHIDYGVRFVGLREQDAEALRRYVAA